MSRLRFDNMSSDDVEYVAMLGVAAFEKPVIDVNHMRAEMMNDQMCKKMCERIRKGNWKKCTEMEQPFMKKSDALTVQNDLIYMGTRVFIPIRYRPDVMAKYHETHQGIGSLKRIIKINCW